MPLCSQKRGYVCKKKFEQLNDQHERLNDYFASVATNIYRQKAGKQGPLLVSW